jgi:hypothetical protein
MSRTASVVRAGDCRLFCKLLDKIDVAIIKGLSLNSRFRSEARIPYLQETISPQKQPGSGHAVGKVRH